MNNIYVGNLSPKTDEGDLESAFASFGRVRAVSIIRDRQTAKSWGYGFVRMETDNNAGTAISHLHETELDGRKLIVESAHNATGRAGSRTRDVRDRNRRW